MTNISSNISTLSREIAHLINPIISDVDLEDTLNSVSELVEDVGAIISEISCRGVPAPRYYLFHQAISAALRYEMQLLPKKDALAQ